MAYFTDGQQNQVLTVSLTNCIIKNRVDNLISVQNSILHIINIVMVNIMYFSDNFYYF